MTARACSSERATETTRRPSSGVLTSVAGLMSTAQGSSSVIGIEISRPSLLNSPQRQITPCAVRRSCKCKKLHNFSRTRRGAHAHDVAQMHTHIHPHLDRHLLRSVVTAGFRVSGGPAHGMCFRPMRRSRDLRKLRASGRFPPTPRRCASQRVIESALAAGLRRQEFRRRGLNTFAPNPALPSSTAIHLL